MNSQILSLFPTLCSSRVRSQGAPAAAPAAASYGLQSASLRALCLYPNQTSNLSKQPRLNHFYLSLLGGPNSSIERVLIITHPTDGIHNDQWHISD